MFPLGTIFAAEKGHKLQSRYNRECFIPISNMDFKFWSIWAAQASKGKIFNYGLHTMYLLLSSVFSCFHGQKFYF